MASRVGPKQKTLTFKDGNISIGPSLTVSIILKVICSITFHDKIPEFPCFAVLFNSIS